MIALCAVFATPLSVFAQTITSVNSSENWSGYVAADGSTYTSVSGSWIVPSVTATSAAAADATWIGIGGIKSGDLIQTGTQAVVDNGSVSYQAWYEILPQYSVNIPITVKAGDSVNAFITEQGAGSNQWLISFVDNTSDQNYHTTISYASSLSSAEWIEEMPTVTVGNSTARNFGLDNFGSVSFTNGSTVQNGSQLTIAQAGGQPMMMLNGAGQSLASPSALGSDNESFSVTRTAAASTSSGSYTITQVRSSGNPSGSYRIIPSQGGRGARVGVGVQGYAQHRQQQSLQSFRQNSRQIQQFGQMRQRLQIR